MGVFQRLKNYLLISDNEDEEMETEYEVPEEHIRASKRARESESVENIRPERKIYRKNQEAATRETADREPVKEKRSSAERSSKIVPIRSMAKGLEVCSMKPTTFEESQEVCDLLLEGRAVIVNLEGFETVTAQRVMDFISGAVYAINGNLHRVSHYIFIISPDSIDLSGDFMDYADKFETFGATGYDKEF